MSNIAVDPAFRKYYCISSQRLTSPMAIERITLSVCISAETSEEGLIVRTNADSFHSHRRSGFFGVVCQDRILIYFKIDDRVRIRFVGFGLRPVARLLPVVAMSAAASHAPLPEKEQIKHQSDNQPGKYTVHSPTSFGCRI